MAICKLVVVCCCEDTEVDIGARPNAKWPMALSHQRMQTGGWARQENSASILLSLMAGLGVDIVCVVEVMPIATSESTMS